MKIVFVNRFFYPDHSATSQLLTDLAFYLAEQGMEIHVVSSRQRYDDASASLLPIDVVRGVNIHRIWTTRFGRKRLFGRAVDYVTFYSGAAWRLSRILSRGDIVVAKTDPPLISVVAAVVAKMRGAHLVNWLQDIFPEVARALGFRLASGPTGSILEWLRDRSLSSAAINVAIGDLMAARLRDRGIAAKQIRVIPNWSTGTSVRPIERSANPLRREWELEGKYVVGYSGNMGRAHDLSPLLDAAERLSYRRDIVFLFIGAGKQSEELEAKAGRRNLSNVMFRAYQPRNMLAFSLTVPDCHVVSLMPSVEGLIVPSKIYSSLAAGRPVLFLGSAEGEIGKLMRSSAPFGICVDSMDIDGLVRAILQLCDNLQESTSMGRNGRQLFEQQFDQHVALAKWTELLSSM